MSTGSGASTPLISIADVKAAAAAGRWGDEILPHFGIDKHSLSGKHSSCPIHGGKDGFRFTDEYRGCWVCATCTGNKFMDGFNLIEKFNEVSNGEAFRMVAQYLRGNQSSPQVHQKTLPKKRALGQDQTSAQRQEQAATHATEGSNLINSPNKILLAAKLSHRARLNTR